MPSYPTEGCTDLQSQGGQESWESPRAQLAALSLQEPEGHLHCPGDPMVTPLPLLEF